jgi:hypothetical protein
MKAGLSPGTWRAPWIVLRSAASGRSMAPQEAMTVTFARTAVTAVTRDSPVGGRHAGRFVEPDRTPDRIPRPYGLTERSTIGGTHEQ